MINLLEETVAILSRHDKETTDVLYVTDGAVYSVWPQFKVWATGLNYNDGYGGAVVNQNLKVVGEGWWLERGEYDGSEWWVFKTMPKQPTLVGRVEVREVW